MPVEEPVDRDDVPSGSGIQNGRVDRLSEMSRILCISLYRDAPSRQEPQMNEGNSRSGGYWFKTIEPRRSQRPRRQLTR